MCFSAKKVPKKVHESYDKNISSSNFGIRVNLVTTSCPKVSSGAFWLWITLEACSAHSLHSKLLAAFLSFFTQQTLCWGGSTPERCTSFPSSSPSAPHSSMWSIESALFIPTAPRSKIYSSPNQIMQHAELVRVTTSGVGGRQVASIIMGALQSHAGTEGEGLV